MFLASAILLFSVALFFFYLQATCEKVIARQFGQEYFQSMVDANRLEFPYVRKVLEEFDKSVDYPWVRLTLECDFLALTYLLKAAANARGRYTGQERLLMFYFRAIFFCLFRVGLFKLREKSALLKLTDILQHFADLIGERLSNLQSGQQTASEYLLTL